jgi:hypothetical protein
MGNAMRRLTEAAARLRLVHEQRRSLYENDVRTRLY